jgi:hypothetical protein
VIDDDGRLLGLLCLKKTEQATAPTRASAGAHNALLCQAASQHSEAGSILAPTSSWTLGKASSEPRIEAAFSLRFTAAAFISLGHGAGRSCARLCTPQDVPGRAAMALRLQMEITKR